MKKQPLYPRILLSAGLIMTTTPALFKEYIDMPDFFRGFLIGAGLVFEIAGLVLIAKRKKAGACL